VVSDQPTLTPNQPTIASAFMGKSVFSSQDPQSDNIGDVSDLIIGQEGKITHAVIGVGGFLGIGQKDVAVPFQELQVVQQDGDLRLIYAATREQLEAAQPMIAPLTTRKLGSKQWKLKSSRRIRRHSPLARTPPSRNKTASSRIRPGSAEEPS
jgi:hypothetical protein